MSAYRFVTLTCDICGEIHDDGGSRRVREARASARAEGWVNPHGDRDECPRHHGYRMSPIAGWVREGS